MLSRDQTIEKIKSFQAEPPFNCIYEKVVSSAAILLSNASAVFNFEGQNVFPGSSGELQLTGYFRKFYIECMIEPGGITFVVEENDAEILYMENQKINKVVRMIREFDNLMGKE